MQDIKALKETADRLDRRARRFALKMKKAGTLSTPELEKLDRLEAEADDAFATFNAAYKASIAA